MSWSAVIEVAFDPTIELGAITLRWQTIAIAAALLAGVALLARQTGGSGDARVAFLAWRTGRSYEEGRFLRLDDLGYLLLAIIPGAVVGGRLVHGLAHWDSYASEPSRLLDPGLGSLSLLGAVLGAILTGALMGRLLAAPIRRWADAAAVPMLLTLGLGKLAQFFGGSGQGAPFSGPWGVSFVGEGPWISASPALASHPSQIYEGIWLLASIIPVASLALGSGGRRRSPGVVFLTALLAFLVGRVLVGFTWRDERALGVLNMEQLLALAALIVIPVGVAGWSAFTDWREARKPIDVAAVVSAHETRRPD